MEALSMQLVVVGVRRINGPFKKARINHEGSTIKPEPL